MDPISTLNQAMQLLRQQLAEKKQRGERTAVGRTGTSSVQAAGASLGDDLPAAIHKQMDTLRAAGVQDENQLSRVAIEMLLRREFGAETANDPSFQQMSDWVYECLNEQPDTRAMLLELVRG
ncbi:hypothetical protein BTH42_14995 [Burkholderia sp. SRS-W-2-2016]|uniref:hypothetical protein n=1 Tax=Burkholderia sp. SRS-W-2-2016 TaxID=1926878 RepID=UPI00094ADE4C|nr:hypothetical protein [Burkholderia sp. SRS-W-2-2016]OLL30878.1 hypothetical protein BTH42_14995 [Burkholderia sp. SRS-W-2-2016]